MQVGRTPWRGTVRGIPLNSRESCARSRSRARNISQSVDLSRCRRPDRSKVASKQTIRGSRLVGKALSVGRRRCLGRSSDGGIHQVVDEIESVGRGITSRCVHNRWGRWSVSTGQRERGFWMPRCTYLPPQTSCSSSSSTSSSNISSSSSMLLPSPIVARMAILTGSSSVPVLTEATSESTSALLRGTKAGT